MMALRRRAIRALASPRLTNALTALLIALALLLPAPVQADTFEDALAGLYERSLKKRQIAIERIAAIDDPRVAPLLDHLLEGRLYYRKADKQLVVAKKVTRTVYAATTFPGNEDLGEVKKRTLKKISVNNRIRRTIRVSLARGQLAATEPSVRLAAIRSMASSLDEATVSLLRERTTVESDSGVLEELEVTIALADVDTGDPERRVAAIRKLGDSTLIAARNKLQALADLPADKLSGPVRAEVRNALAAYDVRASMYAALETLFFGLSLGSVLALAAVGLAITFGVMGVINMAHGELMMLGAYTTYVLQQLMPNHIGTSIVLAVPAAFLVAATFGIAIERGVIRFLYGRPLETLLATFGISLILQQLVRSVFSPLNRAVATPEWMSGALEINAQLSLTYNRLTIVLFTLFVFGVLMIVMKRTPLGLQVRAVAQNRAMARAVGVRSSRVDMLTFALGSGIAGIAGVALSQLTNVGPNLGQGYIVDSFLVVVFGGVGNLWGTLVSGLTLGVANKVMEPWAGAVLAKVLVLVFIILFIQRRPRGLFPQRGRAAEG
ncbi:MAG: urea ABC transporter permease subunit UrtB [Pseudomonadota bacterium]